MKLKDGWTKLLFNRWRWSKQADIVYRQDWGDLRRAAWLLRARMRKDMTPKTQRSNLSIGRMIWIHIVRTDSHIHCITSKLGYWGWVSVALLFSKAPEEGDQCLRAEMSCGHAVTPESLTAWCRSLLDQVLSAGLSAVSSDPLIKLSFVLSCVSNH